MEHGRADVGVIVGEYSCGFRVSPLRYCSGDDVGRHGAESVGKSTQ